MSRSLGLREDQRVREVLVMQIGGLFPLDPVRPYREQARSHRGTSVAQTKQPNVGACSR